MSLKDNNDNSTDASGGVQRATEAAGHGIKATTSKHRVQWRNRVPRTLLEKAVCSMRVLAHHHNEDLGWILRFFIARLLRALEKRPSFDMEMTPLPGWRCLSLTHGLWHASSVPEQSMQQTATFCESMLKVCW